MSNASSPYQISSVADLGGVPQKTMCRHSLKRATPRGFNLALHPDRALHGLPPLILSLSSGFRREVCTTARRIKIWRSLSSGGPLDRRSRSANRSSPHASPGARSRCGVVRAVSTSAAIGLEPFAQFSDGPIRDFRHRNQWPRCRLELSRWLWSACRRLGFRRRMLVSAKRVIRCELAVLSLLAQRSQQPQGAAHLAPHVHRTNLIEHRLPLPGWARFDEFPCSSEICALQDVRVLDFHQWHYHCRVLCWLAFCSGSSRYCFIYFRELFRVLSRSTPDPSVAEPSVAEPSTAEASMVGLRCSGAGVSLSSTCHTHRPSGFFDRARVRYPAFSSSRNIRRTRSRPARSLGPASC